MATIDIDDENFRQYYQENEIVILDFWAIWCGPCHQYAPVYEKVSQVYPEIVFGKVETEVQQKLSGYFGIRGIPTTIIIRQQLEVFRHSGVIGENELVQIIEQVKNVDMDEVRRKIDEEEQKEV